MLKIVPRAGKAELIKFVVTDDDMVYIGRVENHRDLGVPETSTVVGAGNFRSHPELMDLNFTACWRSVGYDVVTPTELRTRLKDLFILLARLGVQAVPNG